MFLFGFVCGTIFGAVAMGVKHVSDSKAKEAARARQLARRPRARKQFKIQFTGESKLGLVIQTKIYCDYYINHVSTPPFKELV